MINKIAYAGILIAVATAGYFTPVAVADWRAKMRTKSDDPDFSYMEKFESDEIDSIWTWSNDKVDYASLKERPGWLHIQPANRVVSYPGQPNARNVLQTPIPAGDFTIETRMDIKQHNLGAVNAGLFFANENNECVTISRIVAGLRVSHSINNRWTRISNFQKLEDDRALTMRFVRDDGNFTGYYRVDGEDWKKLAYEFRSTEQEGWIGLQYIQIGRRKDQLPPAHFDYIKFVKRAVHIPEAQETGEFHT